METYFRYYRDKDGKEVKAGPYLRATPEERAAILDRYAADKARAEKREHEPRTLSPKQEDEFLDRVRIAEIAKARYPHLFK